MRVPPLKTLLGGLVGGSDGNRADATPAFWWCQGQPSQGALFFLRRGPLLTSLDRSAKRTSALVCKSAMKTKHHSTRSHRLSSVFSRNQQLAGTVVGDLTPVETPRKQTLCYDNSFLEAGRQTKRLSYGSLQKSTRPFESKVTLPPK